MKLCYGCGVFGGGVLYVGFQGGRGCVCVCVRSWWSLWLFALGIRYVCSSRVFRSGCLQWVVAVGVHCVGLGVGARHNCSP